jgi:DnaJ homolog subfamily C member 19
MIKLLLFAALAFAVFLMAKRLLAPTSKMSVSEAAKLLDVEMGADAETILAAHRRLIAKVHPDAGGTADLAARVNQARDTLLQQIGR